MPVYSLICCGAHQAHQRGLRHSSISALPILIFRVSDPVPGLDPSSARTWGYDDRWTRGATCSQLPAAAGQLSLGNIASTCSSLDATDQELICMRRSVNPLEPAGMQGAGDGQRAGSRGTGESWVVQTETGPRRGLGGTQMTDNLRN